MRLFRFILLIIYVTHLPLVLPMRTMLFSPGVVWVSEEALLTQSTENFVVKDHTVGWLGYLVLVFVPHEQPNESNTISRIPNIVRSTPQNP